MLPCSLQLINLENNQIIKIQSNTFVQCQQLREINLKGNPMAPEVSAPEHVFHPLRFLRSVSIDWDEDGYERERIKKPVSTFINFHLSSIKPVEPKVSDAQKATN